MKKKIFEKILSWAYKRQVSGYLEEDLRNDLDLTDDDFSWYVKTFRSNMPIVDNLVIHTEYKDNKQYYTLSAKGISKHLELRKAWHEKPLGKILFLLIGAVIGFLVSSYGDFIIAIFKNLK